MREMTVRDKVREEKRKNKGELHVMVSREMWDVGEWKKIK
jgi:hypothetical protein